MVEPCGSAIRVFALKLFRGGMAARRLVDREEAIDILGLNLDTTGLGARCRLRKVFQEIHPGGQVVVPRDGVDLALAQLHQRLPLDAPGAGVRRVVHEHVVGQLRRPREGAGRQGRLSPLENLIHAADEPDQSCRPILLGQGEEVRRVAVEPADLVGKDAAHGPFHAAVELLQERVLRER